MIEKDNLVRYLQDQISLADVRSKAYVFDSENQKKPYRNIFIKLNKYLKEFLAGRSENRWIIMTGLRGAGKSTLLAQLYYEHRSAEAYRLFMSMDQLVQIVGSNLSEIISLYEDILGRVLEKLDKPLLLFLDEVQYEEKWGIFLKSFYDRSKKVFIIATGSSALSLNSNPDVARRAIFEKLYPMNFTEYIKIKTGKFEDKGLAGELRSVIYNSSTAEAVHKGLTGLENRVNSYWIDIERQEEDRYLKYGSLPFMISLDNEALVYDVLQKNIERIINHDIAQAGMFSQDIVSKIPSLLYILADSENIRIHKLSEAVGISRPKIMEILDTLIKAEMLIRVFPQGSHLNQVNKPSKYLFSSPAFRSTYFNFIGSSKSIPDAMGKIQEDAVGMYIRRFLNGRPSSSLTYDAAEGGADFIVTFGSDRILLETGRGDKGFRQISQTAKKTSNKYGLVIARESLLISLDHKAVRLPFRSFLLT